MSETQQGMAVALAQSPPNSPTQREAVSARQRTFGLFLVLAVAFLTSVVSSVSSIQRNHYTYPDSLVGFRYFETLLHELVSLGLLLYVVRQNRQSWMDFGLEFRSKDLTHGIILWGVTTWGYRLLLPPILSLCEWIGWQRAPAYLPSAKLGFGLLTICFVVVNPTFEEMIVRAFLMSETMALTGSATLAVVLSFLLQTSYHLYQGVPYAMALGLIFLVFSIYYARTHRILPVLLAHFLADLWFHLRYVIQAHVAHGS